MSTEIEPISAEKARTILETAIRERLGPQWDDPDHGWDLLVNHDYMARLSKGGKNIDFYVDLLGEVTVKEQDINIAQLSGRIAAWLLLLLSLVIALELARLAGLL